MRPFRVAWTSEDNMGDILTPPILTALGYQFNRVHIHSTPKLISIGSTAKFIKRGDTVWGTGIMRDSDPIEPNARYLAVRGPLTGNKVGCMVYGDPALLCPDLFPMPPPLKDTGCIPHYVDYLKFDTGSVPQINIRNTNPLKVVKELTSFKKIISSSLHGIIIAHAYGIPAAWWKPSDKLNGDGSKFEDYARSVEVELRPSDLSSLEFTLPDPKLIDCIKKNLVKVLNENHQFLQ